MKFHPPLFVSLRLTIDVIRRLNMYVDCRKPRLGLPSVGRRRRALKAARRLLRARFLLRYRRPAFERFGIWYRRNWVNIYFSPAVLRMFVFFPTARWDYKMNDCLDYHTSPIGEMSKKSKKRGSVDPAGSADGEEGNCPQIKKQRESLKPSFHIRLTASKTGSVDQWISGSMDQTPDVVEILKNYFPAGRVALEKGDKTGMYHWQCTGLFFDTKDRKRREAVRKMTLEHWPDLEYPEKDYCEPCEKTWASMQYCAKKDHTWVCGPWEWGVDKPKSRDLKIEDLPAPFKWQSNMMDKYEPEPPQGWCTLDWFGNPDGQIGKTTLAKMMSLKYGKDFYLLDGGAQKMKFQAAKNPARVYVINFTREREEHTPYGGLEAICDNFYCDTFGSEQKGIIVRKPSWVIVFANFFPDVGRMSAGRLNVYEFKDDDWVERAATAAEEEE